MTLEEIFDGESKNLEFNMQNGSHEIRIPWALRLNCAESHEIYNSKK